MRDEANSSFDAAYSACSIYRLLVHPWQQYWESTSYLLQHIAHISGRNDVWKAGFGELYLYHYVQERTQVTVSPVTGDAAFGSYTGPLFLNPGYRWDIHIADMYAPTSQVCLQYNVNASGYASIACECTSPQCNSSTGRGVRTCTIPTNYNYATIAWDISNWTVGGGNTCIAKSAQGPTGTFTTSPTDVTLSNFQATSEKAGVGLIYPVSLLSIFLGMVFSWKRFFRRS